MTNLEKLQTSSIEEVANIILELWGDCDFDWLDNPVCDCDLCSFYETEYCCGIGSRKQSILKWLKGVAEE